MVSSSENTVLALWLVLSIAAKTIYSINVPRPHGVSLIKVSLYQPRDDASWMCLDGKKVIKFVQINDDYCDCADGSDEPGTAACPGGRFHCANIGHRAQNIISSRVNDGICDCCDGSDEFVEDMSNHCVNTCAELGRAEQEQRRSKAELHKRGSARRSELIASGKQLKTERESRRAELDRRLQEQQALKTEKETLRHNAEALENEALEIWKAQQRELEAANKQEEEPFMTSEEARAAFTRFDANNDGFVEVSELQVDSALDRDRDGVVTLDEAKFFLDEGERMDLESFITLAWPKIKTQQMVMQGLFEPPASTEQTEQQQPIIEGAEPQNEENPETEREHDREELEDEEAVEEEESFDEDEEADVGVGSVLANGTPAPDYDPETQILVDQANEARQAHQEVERVVREIEQEIKEIDEQAAKDYGPHEEYAPLAGQCYSFEDREYVYTLCPFDRAAQKQRNGHSETTLGRWHSWADAQGADKYSQQIYTNGASCWNGPQRSVTVQLRCALEERITAVSEPNRCEYFFEFETPAACDNLDAQKLHDEL